MLLFGQIECIFILQLICDFFFNTFPVELMSGEKCCNVIEPFIYALISLHVAQGRQISFSGFTQLHRVRCEDGNLSRSLSFLTYWVSLIPKIKSGGLMSSREAIILAQWRDATADERTSESRLMHASLPGQTDAQSCAFPSSCCVFRGLGARCSYPVWHLIKWRG